MKQDAQQRAAQAGGREVMEGNRHYKIAQEMTKRMEYEREPWRKMQYQSPGGIWQDLLGPPSFSEGYEYRWIPETIMIGDREVRKPVSEPLTLREDYYHANLSNEHNISFSKWWRDSTDRYLLNSGQIGHDAEHAQEIRDAWLAVMRKAMGVGHE